MNSSASTEKLIDTTNYLNPTPDEGLDKDILTAEELLELGYRTSRKRHKQTVNNLCTDCNRPVNAPIMSYTFCGIELLEPGEGIHKGCLDRRVDALIKLVLNK